MKVMQMINRLWMVALVGALAALPVQGSEEQQTGGSPQEKVEQQQPDKWNEAGKEVKEAAGSVADATKETAGTAWDTLKTESTTAWEKTRSGSRELFETVGEKSKEAWQITKEETKDFWEKGKAKIHEVTAPEPPKPPSPPQAPAEMQPGQTAPPDAAR